MASDYVGGGRIYRFERLYQRLSGESAELVCGQDSGNAEEEARCLEEAGSEGTRVVKRV